MDLLIDFMARPVNFNFRSFCNIVLLSFLVNCLRYCLAVGSSGWRS
jgi:hypothetical protein